MGLVYLAYQVSLVTPSDNRIGEGPSKSWTAGRHMKTQYSGPIHRASRLHSSHCGQLVVTSSRQTKREKPITKFHELEGKQG